MRSSFVLILMALSFVAVRSVCAQASSGVSGTIQDSAKAVVQGAKVTITNNSTNATSTVLTNREGFYALPSLPVGTYRITVERTGFATEEQSNVIVNVATPLRLDFTLTAGTISQSVQVTSQALSLDTTSPALGNTLDTKQIETLPINGRDYARLSLLTPGSVARSRYIADLSFDGLHSVHNQFTIDGIDASRVDQPYMANGYERGARLLTGSMETISEFRVQTSGYEAEYGRAAGSLVNIITKTGTNNWHGTLYDYFRNDSLDARNYFARTFKPEFRFNDFGANFNGPIYKDRTFFFVNYEGSRQIIGIIGSGTVLSSSARAQALSLHSELAPILDDMPIGVNSRSNPLLANYSTVSNTNVSENTGSVRVDHRFSDKDSIFARVNVNDSLTFGPLFGVTPTALGINDHQDVPLRTTNVAISETHVFGPRFINNVLIGMQRWTSQLDSYEPIPLVSITGVDAAIGSQGNSLSNNTSFQYGDTMTLVRGNHTLKWGATYYRVQINRNGTNTQNMLYTSVEDFINNIAAQVVQNAGDPGHGTRASQIASFVQDSWQWFPNLTVNYGLRWDWATPPHDKNNETRTYNPATGLLKALGGSYFNTNNADFGPRLGLAWSPRPTTVVRASSGIFYQVYPVGFGSYNVPMNNVPGNITLTSAAIPDLGYPNYQSYLNSSSGLPTNVYGFPAHKPDIKSTQWNVSIAQQLGPHTSFQVAYVGNHGLNIWREQDINYYEQFTTTRPNPNFGDIYLEGNNGMSSYSGFQASLKERFSTLSFDANYSWGHAIDNVQDQGLYASEPQDNNDIKAERGNGSGDVRHNFTFNTIYQIPMGEGHQFLGSAPSPVKIAASGWSVNGIGIFRTGVATNVQMFNNTYGNGDYTNQRPDRVSGQPLYVQQERQANGYISYLNPDGWAYPADGTFGDSPRNGVYGPSFMQVDTSLIKDTKITETQSLQFRAEFFDIFNHPNFDLPNTSYAPGSSSFGMLTSTFGNTIGFGTSRQIQFALKYRF
jgi:outer membrane receptor protein involved in Fe transport